MVDPEPGSVRGGANRDRTRARAWALQVLYRWECSEGDVTVERALAETLGSRRVAEVRVPYLRRLIETYGAHREQVDGRIERALDRWRSGRLARMDLGILRVGTTELLLFDDVPPAVSIHEAVRLAERYGGEASPRFVNGVLDAIHRGD